jgi:hypothetical protein
MWAEDQVERDERGRIGSTEVGAARERLKKRTREVSESMCHSWVRSRWIVPSVDLKADLTFQG